MTVRDDNEKPILFEHSGSLLKVPGGVSRFAAKKRVQRGLIQHDVKETVWKVHLTCIHRQVPNSVSIFLLRNENLADVDASHFFDQGLCKQLVLNVASSAAYVQHRSPLGQVLEKVASKGAPALKPLECRRLSSIALVPILNQPVVLLLAIFGRLMLHPTNYR